MRIFWACSNRCIFAQNGTVPVFHLQAAELLTISGVMSGTGFLISSVVTLFTVCANALTIFVLLRHRPLQKSVSNLYILSLSIADAFIGLFIMPIMSVYYFFQSLNDFFGPNWLCHLWQIADFAASTISLYSICAIALDRFWNLEKPLRVFKRSRRIAYRLIIAIWIVPFTIWTVVYYLFNTELLKPNPFLGSNSCSGPNSTEYNFNKSEADRYCAKWLKNYIPVLIAIPVMYIPVIILITIFVRIAVIVQHHIKFLSANANNNVSSNCSGYPELVQLINSNWNSRGTRGSYTKSMDEQRKITDSSIATVTSVTLRTPPSCISPRSIKHSWNLAPLTEEKSSGRERSHSEQIQTTAAEGIRKFRKKGNSLGSCIIQSSVCVPSIRQSLQNSELLSVYRHNDCVKKTSSADNFFVSHSRYNWMRSSLYSTELTLTTRAQSIDSRKTSRVSVRSKRESRRFSIIPLPHNILELIHREGVLQQIRAAKAVAIILFCFLLCWSPFLILWPIKMYCSKCIPDQVYMISIWLNYVGSALNPVVYTLSSPRARIALRQYLRQRSSFRWKHKIFKRITML